MMKSVVIALLLLLLVDAVLAREDRVIRRLGDMPNEVEEWTPGDLDFETADDSSEQLRSQAEAAEQQGRLAGEDGAVALWLSFMQQAPDDDQALAALDRLRERWVARIARLFDQGDRQAIANQARDLEQLGAIEALAPARLAADRSLGWLAQRPDIADIDSPEQWRNARQTQRELSSQVGEPTWLAQDSTTLEQRLVELWQTQRDLDAPQAGLDWIALAEDQSITLPGQQDFLAQVETRRQQNELAAIGVLIDAGDFALASQRLAELPDPLPQRQSLQQRIDHGLRLAALQVGELVALGDDPRIPDMVYVGQLSDQGEHLLVSQHEITVAQYRAFAEATGTGTSHTTQRFDLRDAQQRPAELDWRSDYIGGTAADQNPVIHVSWNDAKAYSEWLSSLSGETFRLPSGAEFERYAGNEPGTRYWWGNGVPASAVENLAGEHDRSPRRHRHPDAFAGYADEAFGPTTVASYRPNPLGLYDIIGNVAEWTRDCASANSNHCRGRVVKGGHWRSPPAESLISHQRLYPGDQACNTIGFRVVMVID